MAAFEREAKRILAEVEEECGWMYETLHVEPASSRLIEETGFKKPVFSQQNTGANQGISGFTIRQDYLPHWQSPGAFYFLTFNTKDRRVLTPESRTIVMNSLKYWHGQRLNLIGAVVMPDHVHAVLQPLSKSVEPASSRLGEGNRRQDAGSTVYWDLSDLLHSIKSYSANEINKDENRQGETVWQTESYDRIIRDEKEYGFTLQYIVWNPVKAELADSPEKYEWFLIGDAVKKAGWKPAPLGKINYTVWSDVFVCPECTKEVIFWEAAVDKKAGSVMDEFPCPHCSANLTKRKMERAWVTKYDKVEPASSRLNNSSQQDAGSTIRQAKQVPVLINYSVGLASSQPKRFEKIPDAFDLALIEKLEQGEIPYWFPTNRMMEGKETRRNDPIGITHVHHFYTKNALYELASIWNKYQASRNRVSSACLLTHTAASPYASKLRRFRADKKGGGPLAGTLYIASLITPPNPIFTVGRNVDFVLNGLQSTGIKKYSAIISTQSNNQFESIESASIDYLFIDPPFGSNLNYSELNFLWESWLKVWTNNKPEAIENSVQGKGLNEYRQLMTACFKEAYRVLKPGHWMTVEFSNTKASVWNSIQTALAEAGFIVANVSALDKKQGSFKAVTTPTAVKQDLVISAYKPNGGFEERFQKEAATEEGVWDFVRTHLKPLPVTKSVGLASSKPEERAGWKPALQFIAERDPRILFDQMISFYVRKGYPVPISSQEFQIGLAQRFIERDGMYFLPDQAAEYDRKKMVSGACFQQAVLFVSDEASAIQWLRRLLKGKPQTFSDINPQFMQQLGCWSKNEAQLDLRELLNQNFLCYVGQASSRPEPVPSQIHSYLSSNWPEMRRLEADSTTLVTKARDRWYVPDPNKAGDLEKLRERSLLKEFEEYVALASSQPNKKLKVFRLEAVRAGFKKAWQERDYATIVSVANKIPNNVLEEDPKLLMWYDQAITRMGGE